MHVRSELPCALFQYAMQWPKSSSVQQLTLYEVARATFWWLVYAASVAIQYVCPCPWSKPGPGLSGARVFYTAEWPRNAKGGCRTAQPNGTPPGVAVGQGHV